MRDVPDPLLLVSLGDHALKDLHHVAAHLARLAQRYRLVVTHGGRALVDRWAARALAGARQWPLDLVEAEGEGLLGYLLEREIANRLPDGRSVVTLLTRVEVAVDDPGFGEPGVRVGPLHTLGEREVLERERGWRFEACGEGFVRVLPSVAPQRVVNLRAVSALLDLGAVVVCAGSGGIPVAAARNGEWQGVEALVDKDEVSSLLACQLHADMLLLAIDQPALYLDWGWTTQRPVHTASPAALRATSFESSSIRRKVEAACRFAETSGRPAIIGNLADADRFAAHEAGTWISVQETGAG